MPPWFGIRDLIQVIVFLATIGATYFNLVERVSLAENTMASYKERMIRAEQDIHQETLGYRNIQSELSHRLEELRKDAQADRRRIESKLDTLKDLIMQTYQGRA